MQLTSVECLHWHASSACTVRTHLGGLSTHWGGTRVTEHTPTLQGSNLTLLVLCP